MFRKSVYIMLVMMAIIFCSCSDQNLYNQEILDWRKERVAELIAPNGWASLVGLYWLKSGTTWIGLDSNSFQINDKILDTIGSIFLDSSTIIFESHDEHDIYQNGEKVVAVNMVTDKADNTTKLSHKQFTWTIIDRNSKIGLRVWDTTHQGRTMFTELDYFDIDRSFRVEATFNPFEESVMKPVKNIFGMEIIQKIPGILTFNLQGKPFSLEPIETSSDEYFLVFADETTGEDSYGGGRYLYCSKPDPNNKTIIDFNKSFTPPCGFTEFATCLIPTKANILNVAILAGEKYLYDH